MKNLSKVETQKIIAGASLSGTLISAITKAYNAILDLGRAFGSTIRRIVSKKSCSL
ncbi:MAG: hypothetical protein IJB71_03660 [Bacilli bacterium]|nr:hypothetical protein [Bacilli bacterium]